MVSPRGCAQLQLGLFVRSFLPFPVFCSESLAFSCSLCAEKREFTSEKTTESRERERASPRSPPLSPQANSNAFPISHLEDNPDASLDASSRVRRALRGAFGDGLGGGGSRERASVGRRRDGDRQAHVDESGGAGIDDGSSGLERARGARPPRAVVRGCCCC